jgi:uncharacterized membrane protein HdeD (DUF308 family)
MSIVLTRSWWAIALGGVAAVLFGLLTFIWPGLGLAVLVALFGAYALVDGVFSLITAAEGAAHHRSFIWPLLVGVAGIVAGLVAFNWPRITALALLWIIAAWAIVTGILHIVAAFHLRNDIADEWLLSLSGAMLILLGLMPIVQPEAGALGLLWAIGTFAIISGVVRIGLAFRLRSLQHLLAAPRAITPPLAGANDAAPIPRRTTQPAQ